MKGLEMLSRQTAEKALEAVKVGNAAAAKIYASLNKSKGTLSASAHKKHSAEVRELKLLANNVCKKLAGSFNSVADLNRAMKIEAVNRLLADAAQMRLTAEILDEVLEDSDELAMLPDEVLEAEDEVDEVDEVEDETEAEVEVEDETEAEDETDEVEAEDDLDLIEEDEIVSKRANVRNLRAKSAKAVKASNSFGFNWNFGKSGR